MIIPGIYFLFRLSFSDLSYLDRKKGVMRALRHSWDITKGDKIWTVIFTLIVLPLLILIGSLVLYFISAISFFSFIVASIILIIGNLVLFVIFFIVMAKLYRALSMHHSGHMAVAPQPVEIPAHTELAPEHHHESETPAQ